MRYYRVRSFIAAQVSSSYTNTVKVVADRYDSYPPIAAGGILHSEGGTIQSGVLTLEAGEQVRLSVDNPNDFDDFYRNDVKVTPHRDEDRDNLFFDWKGNNYSAARYADSNGTFWTAPNVTSTQTYTLTVEVNDSKLDANGIVIGGRAKGHPRNDSPITRTLPVRVVPLVNITFDETVVKAGISYMGKDVRGTIVAKISPVSGASFISFKSSDTNRATITEVSRTNQDGATFVTIKVKGESPTPISFPAGDAQVEAKRWTKLLKTAQIKVVIPRYADYSVGSPSYQNYTIPSIVSGQVLLGTYVKAIIGYNIRDQFGDTLISAYNGANVVEEIFSQPQGNPSVTAGF